MIGFFESKFLLVLIICSAPILSVLTVKIMITTQVGFAEFNNTADNRANVGGTIIGAPIVGQ